MKKYPLIKIIAYGTFVLLMMQSLDIWINEKLINNIFDKIPFYDNTLILLYVAFILILFILTCKYYKKIISSDVYKLYGCVFLFVFLIYRLNIIHHSWEFVPLYGHLKYIDLLGLFIVSTFYIDISPKEKAIIDKRAPHESVKNPKDDKFNYYSDARRLLDFIISNYEYYANGAFVVGIEGAWGNGKTSYLNMIKCILHSKEEAKKFGLEIDNIRVIDFNPWLCQDDNLLHIRFFDSIINGVDDNNLKVKFNDYLDAFTDTRIGFIFKFLKIKRDSVYERFKEVNNELRNSNTRIFVLIDDIDRLSQHELLMLFKLLRNTANFSNIIYMIAYDRKYIESMLKELSEDGIEKYWDKIINFSQSLPNIGYEELTNYYVDKLLEVVDNKEEKNIRNFINLTKGNLSLRKIINLSYELKFQIKRFTNKGKLVINVFDLLCLNYLNYNHNDLYNDLMEDILFKVSDDNSLIYIDENDRILLNQENFGGKNDVESFNNKISAFVGDKDYDIVKNIMFRLFDNGNLRDNSMQMYNYAIMYIMQGIDFQVTMLDDILDNIKTSENIDVFLDELCSFVFTNKKLSLLKIGCVKCDSIKEWVNVFYSVLTIMPKSYLIYRFGIMKENNKIPVVPGNNILNTFTIDEINMYIDSLSRYIKECNFNDSRNMTLILSFLSSNNINNMNIHKDKIYVFYDVVTIMIKEYFSSLQSYKDFSEDYCCVLRYLPENNRDEIVEIIKQNIIENFDSFKDKYCMNIDNSFILTVFSNNTRDAKHKFKEFLKKEKLYESFIQI